MKIKLDDEDQCPPGVGAGIRIPAQRQLSKLNLGGGEQPPLHLSPYSSGMRLRKRRALVSSGAPIGGSHQLFIPRFLSNPNKLKGRRQVALMSWGLWLRIGQT